MTTVPPFQTKARGLSHPSQTRSLDIQSASIELAMLLAERERPNHRSRHPHTKIRALRLFIARCKGTHTKAEWLALVEEFGGACVRCLSDEQPMTKDHIIPIYQSGSDGIDNLQPLCKRCNCQKGPDTTNWVKKRRELRARIID